MDTSTLEQEFLSYYDQWNDAVFRHCYFRVSDRDKAKDLTQDTFRRLWKHLTEGGLVDQPKAFIFRIANNLIIDTYRKRTEASLDALTEAGFDIGEDGRNDLMNVMTAHELIELLDHINDSYRDVIVMRYVDDMSVKDIAEMLEVTENNVSVRLHRGLQKLRELAQKT